MKLHNTETDFGLNLENLFGRSVYEKADGCAGRAPCLSNLGGEIGRVMLLAVEFRVGREVFDPEVRAQIEDSQPGFDEWCGELRCDAMWQREEDDFRVGLEDRGEIAAGKRADLARVRVIEGAPVVVERNPNYYNLIGRIDYVSQMGTMVTDHTMIKPGSLLQANGGFIVIRIRDLLTHSAGFVDDNPWGDRQTPLPDADFTRMLEQGVPMSSAPATHYEYSNFGYALLGRIIANVSGMPYRRYVEQSLLTPLGMASSGYQLSEWPVARRSRLVSAFSRWDPATGTITIGSNATIRSSITPKRPASGTMIAKSKS